MDDKNKKTAFPHLYKDDFAEAREVFSGLHRLCSDMEAYLVENVFVKGAVRVHGLGVLRFIPKPVEEREFIGLIFIPLDPVTNAPDEEQAERLRNVPLQIMLEVAYQFENLLFELRSITQATVRGGTHGLRILQDRFTSELELYAQQAAAEEAGDEPDDVRGSQLAQMTAALNALGFRVLTSSQSDPKTCPCDLCVARRKHEAEQMT